MKNKKKIRIALIIMTMLLPLCAITAFCVWYVSDHARTSPSYDDQFITKYVDSQMVTYDNVYVLPGPETFDDALTLDDADFSYYYRPLGSTEDYKLCENGREGPKNAGSYDIMIRYKIQKLDENGDTITEEKEVSGISFTINKLDLTNQNAKIELVESTETARTRIRKANSQNGDDIKYTYTSQAIKPNFNVIVTFSGGRTVKLNENEYEVSYNNNINVGVGNISLKILENSTNFTGSVTKEFTIVPFDISNGAIEIIGTYTYLGTLIQPEMKVTAPLTSTINYELQNSDYTVAYQNATNAGTIAKVIITGKDNFTGTLTKGFTIEKATLDISNMTTSPTFSSIFEGELENGIIPTLSEAGTASFNGKKIDGSFTFTSISKYTTRSGSNSKYYYDINGTSSSSGYVAKVTYVFTPNDTSNFNSVTITDHGSITIKPVAYSGSTYYGSIEHALDKVTSGTINVLAEVSVNNRRIRSNCTIASGVTLQFLYSASTNIIKNTTDYFPKETKHGSQPYALDSTTYRKNLIYVDENVILTNNGKLIIGGIISSGGGGIQPNCQTCADYAEIVLKSSSQIINNSGSYLVNYGAIKDKNNTNSGSVIINNGANLQMPFVLIEHRGGSTFSGVYDSLNSSNPEKGAAFNRFFFQNICSNLVVNSGGIFLAYANLYASRSDNETKINVIGSSSSYLVNLKNGAYLNAKYNNTTRINKLDFYGNFDLNPLKMSAAGATISTSKVFFPISWYYNVTTNKLPNSSSNAKVTLNQDIKILPGAKVRIGQNVEATAKNIIVYDKFADKAVNSTAYPSKDPNNNNINIEYGRLYVNGKLTIQANGSIGGLIETERNDAQLQIDSSSSTSVTSYELASSTGSGFSTTVSWNAYTRSFSIYPYTISGTASKAVSGATGTLYSRDGGWYATTISINYDSCGGNLIPSKTGINIDTNGYSIMASDLIIPSKDYYEFNGWYLDSDYSQQILEGYTLYCSITLFAKYNPIEYDVEYVNKYQTNNESSIISTTGDINKFTVETERSLFEPQNGDYVFGGWFTDLLCTEKISMFKGQDLVDKVVDGKLKLYALWYSAGTKKYVITYMNDSTDVTCEPSYTQVVTDTFNWNDYSLPNMITKDNDYSVTKYFGGWYNEEQLVTTVAEDMFVLIDGVYRLTLTAKWLDKNVLTIIVPKCTSTIGFEFNVYYKQGTKFTIPNLEDKGISLNHNPEDGEVLINWVTNDGTTYATHSEITLENQTTLTATIKRYVKISIGASPYTNSEIILVANMGYTVTINNSIATVTPFAGETLGNSASKFITVDSHIKARWIAVSGSEANGASVSSPGLANTSGSSVNSLTNTSTEYIVVSNANSIVITLVGQDSSCIIKGTLITLADGTKRKVEDLKFGDIIKTWSFSKGGFDYQPVVAIEKTGEALFDVLTIVLENGYEVKIISYQSFFDMNARCYFEINLDNYLEAIGKEIMIEESNAMASSKIVDVRREQIFTTAYELITAEDFNFFADGILTIEPFIFCLNIFEINEDYQYDQIKLQADIEEYGLYTYDEWKDYLTEEEFQTFNGQYFKVAVGKGLTTIEYILEALEIYKNNYSH